MRGSIGVVNQRADFGEYPAGALSFTMGCKQPKKRHSSPFQKVVADKAYESIELDGIRAEDKANGIMLSQALRREPRDELTVEYRYPITMAPLTGNVKTHHIG